ncbi:hypothetical protein J7M28_12860 [bacterium]|nr:hypothetical protein [bacterium]
MTVQELEDKVWKLDGIRIVVRASVSTQVGDYSHKNKGQNNWRISEFVQKRLAGLLSKLEVVVLMGNGQEAHGNTLLSSIRDSYSNE